MTFEYPKEIIKKEMQKGLFYTLLAISLFVAFFFLNFNYGAFTGHTKDLKHIIPFTNYWYPIIGMGILIFLGNPCLMAAINRKITKYEVSSSGIYVVSKLRQGAQF